MPHKRAKRSVRLANSEARGQDNPPTAADSLLPITTTAEDGSEAKAEDGEGKKRSNKRRKGAGAGGGAGQDLAGMSKSAYRIINAVALREEHHAKKKRKLEEDEGKNPNQKKKPALTPLPYESLSSFNRRVEQEMRGSVRSAIKDAGAAAQKKRDKKGKEKAKKNGEGDEEDDEDEEEQQQQQGGKAKKPKPTPEESFDPFASKRLQQQQREAQQNRSGKTEFDSAPLRRRVDDVVQAPPTLAPAARKGLLAKVLGPGGAASDGGVSSEGGPVGGYRLKGAEEPVGSSRLPINPAMKALLDQERERAVRMYRELKEKKEREKVGQ